MFDRLLVFVLLQKYHCGRGLFQVSNEIPAVLWRHNGTHLNRFASVSHVEPSVCFCHAELCSLPQFSLGETLSLLIYSSVCVCCIGGRDMQAVSQSGRPQVTPGTVTFHNS